MTVTNRTYGDKCDCHPRCREACLRTEYWRGRRDAIEDVASLFDGGPTTPGIAHSPATAQIIRSIDSPFKRHR